MLADFTVNIWCRYLQQVAHAKQDSALMVGLTAGALGSTPDLSKSSNISEAKLLMFIQSWNKHGTTPTHTFIYQTEKCMLCPGKIG